MNKTSIEWTHRPETGGEAGGFTWNPIRAKAAVPNGHRAGTFCTRISPGCLHCYASTINKRFGNGLEFTVPNLEKVEFFIDEKILAEPLRRKKPATIFVGDMFDLFHEAIPKELIDRVFAVMALASGTVPHTRNLERPAVAGLQVGSGQVRLVAGGAERVGGMRAAMSNSFGFGGANAALCFTVPPPGMELAEWPAA